MTLTEIARRLGEARIRVRDATARRDEEQVQLDVETGVGGPGMWGIGR